RVHYPRVTAMTIDPLLLQTRRHFFGECAMGLGSLGLASLLSNGQLFAADTNPLAAKKGHFPAKAKSVIFLFMAGGPSQLEMFDYKPKLDQLNGQPPPASFVEGKRFAFMNDANFPRDKVKLLGTKAKFGQHGQSGAWVSDLLPHTAGIVDDIAIVRSM